MSARRGRDEKRAGNASGGKLWRARDSRVEDGAAKRDWMTEGRAPLPAAAELGQENWRWSLRRWNAGGEVGGREFAERHLPKMEILQIGEGGRQVHPAGIAELRLMRVGSPRLMKLKSPHSFELSQYPARRLVLKVLQGHTGRAKRPKSGLGSGRERLEGDPAFGWRGPLVRELEDAMEIRLEGSRLLP